MADAIHICDRRRAGVLLPLFSAPSTRSWGIGEIGDLPDLAAWMRKAGLDLLQMLPVNEMASGQSSPYSALSAMAIDPIYIALHDVLEFQQIGGESIVSPSVRQQLDAVREASRVDYPTVRKLKDGALRAAYTQFATMGPRTKRVKAFTQFVQDESWWLEDYALFRALHHKYQQRAWWDWDDRMLQTREPADLKHARAQLMGEVRYYQYLQWIADQQWREARAKIAPIGLFGDLPFMVGADSADVWANQDFFARDLSVGTPPDAFSATGQDWGLPAYRWDVNQQKNFPWLRARARRAKALFEGFRVDHVIGFYRTYVRPAEGDPYFTPGQEPEQIALGERVMRLFQETGACVIAEDLGTVPDFLRESLGRLAVPGYRVLRWEREWHQDGQPFRDPAWYPPLSLATSGTHDTDPIAVWWDEAPHEERRDVASIPRFANHGSAGGQSLADQPFGPAVRDAIVRLLYTSGSNLLVMPMQDLFGWRDRVNTPATVGAENWSWRLPWPVDRLLLEDEPLARAQTLSAWARDTSRGLGADSQ